MHSHLPSYLAIAILCVPSGALVTPNQTCLPTVDLGYEVHKAITYNATTDVYKFSNIRYAQPPSGQLRFRAPLPPLEDRSRIQDGAQYRACPQGIPHWQANAYIPIGKYTGPSAPPFSLETWEHDIATS
ncbi:carboxylesterase family protein-like protein [Apiospora arundinis]|uniref:Carboxylesterase family protein-like protein n=1 Tax=Apiospora arundinis TaxID=335852 RepID=A0ABR2HYD1_9PEZI